MKLKKCTVLALSIFAFAISGRSQPGPKANWANLNQLNSGSEIRVTLADGRMLRGFLQGAAPDSLSINATTSQEKLARADIKRVQMKRRGHRGRNTLIGLAVGTGAGVAIGAGVDNNSGWFNNFGKLFFTPVGAIIGTVVGVAIPTGGWREIYRVK